METIRIKTSQLVMNEGQVAGIPTNPRQWTQADVDRIAESLRETPELFDMRPCIVYPYGGKFVILGGNLRYTGAKKNKAKEVPCIVVPEDTPLDKLKAIVIKDNGSFGSWDYDMLGNEWDSLPLSDWGVPAWDTKEAISPDDFGEDFTLPDEQRSDYKQISFTLPILEADLVLEIVKLAKYSDEFPQNIEEDNSNGIALSLIVNCWLDRMKQTLGEREKRITEEDIRKELQRALKKSGVTMAEVNKKMGNQMAGHYFNPSQWMFPTRENFMKMSELIDFERTYEAMRDDYLEARISDMFLKKIDKL